MFDPSVMNDKIVSTVATESKNLRERFGHSRKIVGVVLLSGVNFWAYMCVCVLNHIRLF